MSIYKLSDATQQVSKVPTTTQTITAQGAAVKPLVVKGAASQTANLLEALNSASASLFAVDPNGLITGSGSSLGAWTSYAPTFSGGTWAVGNGVFTNTRYVQIGKIVIYTGLFTFGSTTVKDASTSLLVSLPVATTQIARGTGEILKSGTANYSAGVTVASTGMNMRAITVSGSLLATTGFTSTNPITWATSDNFSWTVVYEAS